MNDPTVRAESGAVAGRRGAEPGDDGLEATRLAALDALRHLLLTVEQLRPAYGALAGVGDTDLMALGNLIAHGPMSAAELATRLGVTRSSVTALVDRLEEAHLVVRHADPDDRRRLRLVVTGQGEAAVARARSLSLGALHAIEPGHLPALTETLHELATALDNHAAPRTGT